MRNLRIGAAIGVAVTALALPASALAALSGHSHGYTLTFRGGYAKLTLPSVAKPLTPYQVRCGAPGKEQSVVAMAPMSASATMQGPAEAPKSHRCVIQKRGHKVAVVHLH
jgi:hypothetical protein